MNLPKRTDYATRKEYRWARKNVVRPIFWSVVVIVTIIRMLITEPKAGAIVLMVFLALFCGPMLYDAIKDAGKDDRGVLDHFLYGKKGK
jgi:hypothetical protein